MKPNLKSFPLLLGISSAIIAAFCQSINDVAIKFLSGGYALHQVVLVRSSIGLAILLAVILPFSNGWRTFKTRRIKFHILRGCLVFFANITFFLGLAALPLAEGVAIFFISPMLITVFSVVFLQEAVGLRRWMAIILGLLGVIIMLRPGVSTFQFAALLPLLAAFGYASVQVLTRYIGRTETAVTMSFYSQITFIVASGLFGLVLGDGRFEGNSDPSLSFLFRAWSLPAPEDYVIFISLGCVSALGSFFVSQAYRASEAAFIAPIEYIALPLAIMWGVLVFGHWPDFTALIGIALILGSGLYMIWRETRTALNM